MEAYLTIFERLKANRAAALWQGYGLAVKTGTGYGAAIIKLLKPAWTTDGPEGILNSNGLFFSVWVDAACERQGHARYNLHAKKLRAIKGPAFAAREFARSFRAEAKTALAEWPGCSFPKGPITLFEGRFALDPATLGDKTSALLDRFATLTPLMDRLFPPPTSGSNGAAV